MATSLEVRAPILDHVFMEFVTRLPSRWKLRRGVRKYIFRKLAERLGVPHQVLFRRKQGFSLPLVHWMRKELKEDLSQILLEPRTLQRGYFAAQSVGACWTNTSKAASIILALIWQLLVFRIVAPEFFGISAGVRNASIVACFGENK